MPISNYIPSSRLIQPGVCTSATRPASPYEGMVIYETDTNKTYVYNGSSWVMQISADTPPGLELVKTQTVGSGVSSVEVTGAFSSNYDNYLITLSGGTQSTDTNITMQMGSTASGYYGSLIYGAYSGGSANNATNNNYSLWDWAGGGSAACHAYIEVIQPYLALPTEIRARVRYSTVYGNYVGHLANYTQYTSFKFIPTGTLTGGTIRVYGYRN